MARSADTASAAGLASGPNDPTTLSSALPSKSSSAVRKAIVEAASGVIAARTAHPGWSLEKLYDASAMPSDLADAHKELDAIVDKLYGRVNLATEPDRQRALLRQYAMLNGQEGLL